MVLHPLRLLDIVHNYVTFMQTDEGKTVKVGARGTSSTARSAGRSTGSRPARRGQQDGDQDRRGGIIWHTQGSGKSLTMTFLVRKMRTVPACAGHQDRRRDRPDPAPGPAQRDDGADRRDVDIAKKIRQRQGTLLSQHGPGIVCVMIQKQQDLDAAKTRKNARSNTGKDNDKDDTSTLGLRLAEHGRVHRRADRRGAPVARIDAAHEPAGRAAELRPDRLHRHADPHGAEEATTEDLRPLHRRLPARRRRTRTRRSCRSTTPAARQGRGPRRPGHGRGLRGHVRRPHAEEMEEIKSRYATKGDVMEAEELIAAKAKNMLRHYVETVLPNGFKAQVVAHSRRAALRYRDALINARDELVAQIEKLPAATERDPRKPGPAHRVPGPRRWHLDLLQAARLRPGHLRRHDERREDWETWTDPDKQQKAIARLQAVPERRAGRGRSPPRSSSSSRCCSPGSTPRRAGAVPGPAMKEAELLQAVARVNRPGRTARKCGYVIDYVGVTQHLTEALKAYAAEESRARSKTCETADRPTSAPQRDRMRLLFTDHGVTPGRREDAWRTASRCWRTAQLRDRFETELNRFLATVDTVLPLPEAGPYLPDAKLFAEIAMRARRRYRSTTATSTRACTGRRSAS